MFAPGTYISREQFALMLFRAAETLGLDTSVPDGFGLDQFTDRGSIQSWAEEAMVWAVYHGLISGTSTTTLSPLGQATRAESAAILTRFVQEFID